MITNKELNEISLSPTKKDYYQIWNELIELASKISDRWSPESTNESDPGIVLLKALTAIADKLNYNIDKNTLEAFMPSATQVESMRKLTEMMGYSMKHYISATCDATITYTNANDYSSFQIYFPKFVNLKDEEEEVNYVTIEDFTLTAEEPTRQIPCIEGELVECETNSDNVISMIHLDDNNRYFLPEMTIAENGIFITNVYEINNTTQESEEWIQVDNLNSQLPGACVYKFGVSAARGLPYIQFPDDISQIIGDGIRIRYIRTNGVNGNIKMNTLTKLEVPALWSTADDVEGDAFSVKNLTADDFKITNASAAKNGADPESINAAYNNFKKTVGTFDTLVTCRDYMNKIYQLTESQTDTTPLVSNAIVSDIRDDINNAYTICSFNNYGICYSSASFKKEEDGVLTDENAINQFDLILYPFKTIYGLNTKDEFVNSFKYDASNTPKILSDIALNKTIAHNIKLPENGDLYCIKNYLKIKAKITTVRKVTVAEEKEILEKVKKAIYATYNMRQLDFGEDLPDTLRDTIRYADTRIKDVDPDEPELFTRFSFVGDNGEYDLLASPWAEGSNYSRHEAYTGNNTSKNIYNKMVLRNVLAGRIAAFNYDTTFATNYAEKDYSYTDTETGKHYDNTYGETAPKITSLVSKFELPITENDLGAEGYTLKANEVVQFRTTNFKTTITYPSYVNYYIKLGTKTQSETTNSKAIPATFMGFNNFMKKQTTYIDFLRSPAEGYNSYWEEFVNENEIRWSKTFPADKGPTTDDLNNYIIFKLDDEDIYRLVSDVSAAVEYKGFRFETTNDGQYNFALLYSFITGLLVVDDQKLRDAWTIYRSLGFNTTHQIGKLVDESLIKYTPVTNLKSSDMSNYFVPELHTSQEAESGTVTIDGLGESLELSEVLKNAEYQLQEGEYLLINYTESASSEDSSQETKRIINKYYGSGTIIKSNFALVDSDIYASSHTAPKKTGYDFTNYGVDNPAGMFTLNTDEQICIREPASISLYDKKDKDKDVQTKLYYIYFIRNDDKDDGGIQYFTFDEYQYDASTTIDENTPYNAYTLKEGEYVFFTDKSKMNLGYYGNGTTVVITNTNITNPNADSNNKEIYKNNDLGSVSAEDIVQNGISAIPWGTAYNFSGDFNLTFVENQYISLTEGDTLKAITLAGSSNAEELDNTWKEAKDAKYLLAEAENDDVLPKINVAGYNWNVRSRLDFNMGSNVGQTLNEYDSITLIYEDDSKTPEVLEPLTTDNDIHPLTVYSNYPCQLAHHIYTPNTELTNIVPFVVKLADIQNPVDSNKHVNLNNYTDGVGNYTKVNVEDFNNGDGEPLFELNTNIPDSEYGLVMFYYIDENIGSGHTNAYIEAKGADGHLISGIRIFNQEFEYTDEYELDTDPGIQVLQIDPSVKTLSIYPDSSKKSTIIFSELSLIKGINPYLDYKFGADEQGDQGLDDLLEKIRMHNTEGKFYYNMPVDNNRAIDLNYLVHETLSTPDAWYDPNNECNKFVISEISADDLDTGIVLTKVSKA